MLSLHNIGPVRNGVQTKPAMNLKTTLQTLWRIERLLDGWQSSGDIPAIERDLACDLLRRTYADIFFSDKNEATALEASLAENTPTDCMNETAVSETAGTPVDAAVATGDAHIADVVLPIGLVGLAPSGKPAEEMPEESPENAEAVVAPAAENASSEMHAESSAEEDASVETSVEVPAAENASSEMPAESSAEEDASVETSVEVPAAENASLEMPVESPAEEDASVETPIEVPTFIKKSVEESTSVKEPVDEPISVGEPAETPSSIEKSDEENVSIGMSVGEPAGEDTPVEVPVGEVAEEEIPVEEFGVFEKTDDTVEEFEVFGGGDAVKEFVEPGNAVEESGDTVSSAEVVADPIPETSIDVVIDPVFEVFNDEDEDAEKTDGAEKSEDADTAGTVGFVEAVNVMEAVESVGAAEDTEIEEEVEVMEEVEAEETETEQLVAASAAIHPVTEAVEPVAESAAESTAEPGRNPVFTHAPAAGTSAGEAPADAAASSTETLEEMAARFKNTSGRRRKSRRAFLSLYDDDETGRRGARNDQLELSDWGVEPSDPASNLRHARELFGLPVDDLDTPSEPTPQPAADAGATDDEIEVEVIDFAVDDDLAQNDRDAKPAAESFLKPAAEPTSEPAAAPTQPTPRLAVAPTREERDDADDDLPFDEAVVALEDPDNASAEVPHLEPGSPEHSESSDAVSFDSIEIVEIADGDEVAPKIEVDETQHTDRVEVADESAKCEAAAPAASATEPAAVRGLYGHGEKPELPASTTVLGEVMGHDVPTVGDSLGRRPDVAGWTGVHDDLNRAISVGDRFVLLRDLFDGDQALCDRTLKRLSTFDDLDDCMIWITENFAWNANSEGAKLIMGLLERKLG